jgi:hypothetical protein
MKHLFISAFWLALSTVTVLAQDYNTHLQQELLDILETDQKYRIQADSVRKTHGNNSQQMKKLLQTIREQDSINPVKVKAILDKYGWLGPDKIGSRPYMALFLVIQHSDQQTQEEFLPMIRIAVKRGDALASDLALLEDWVALGQGKKQLYGSQIGQDEKSGKMYVLPLDDPDNVDKRRLSVGLPPMAEYVQYFGITWNLEEYKKQQANTKIN